MEQGVHRAHANEMLTCPFLPYLPPHDLGRGGGEATLTGGGGDAHFLTQVQPYLPLVFTQMQPDGGGDDTVGEGVATGVGEGDGTLTTAGGGLHGTSVQTFLP